MSLSYFLFNLIGLGAACFAVILMFRLILNAIMRRRGQ